MQAVAAATIVVGFSAVLLLRRQRRASGSLVLSHPPGAPLILVDANLPSWKTDASIAEEFRALLPTVPILGWDACDTDEKARVDLSHVRMVIVVTGISPDLVSRLPRLALVQKLGAGVEGICGDVSLPDKVRVTRLKPSVAAREIAEYALAYTLRRQRNMDFHTEQQRLQQWTPLAPKATGATVIGVLGLGHIGGLTARTFASLGFVVLGWARSAHSLPSIECLTGERGLMRLLGEADVVVAILPSTAETRCLLNARRLDAMKRGSLLINAGRGDLLDEPALLTALDRGRPGSAVLDVTCEEPLGSSSPLWRHPRVTITPHVSGWRVDGGMEDVAENWRRLVSGQPLLHEVDRSRGY